MCQAHNWGFLHVSPWTERIVQALGSRQMTRSDSCSQSIEQQWLGSQMQPRLVLVSQRLDSCHCCRRYNIIMSWLTAKRFRTGVWNSECSHELREGHPHFETLEQDRRRNKARTMADTGRGSWLTATVPRHDGREGARGERGVQALIALQSGVVMTSQASSRCDIDACWLMLA